MSDVDLSNYQCDHLMLLVGGNPLPNAVAGRLLVRPGGRITLLHSKGDTGTGKVAGCLANWFCKQGMSNIALDEMDEVDKHDIHRVMQSNLGNASEKIGLHYTGGTKAMAVHAHKAVQEKRSDAIFSYLDARTLCFVFDDGVRRYVGQHPQLQITIKEIFDLHSTPLREKRDGSTSHLEVLPDNASDQKGEKFEKEVGREMLKLRKNGQISDMWMNVKAELAGLDDQKWPEFDVIALRGYQLFFISCATTDKRPELKQKLFEAFIRGRQLGGDETCIALVCMKNDLTLEYEAQQTFQVKGRVKVFGGNHLPNLSQYLSDWIRQQSREGKEC